MLFSLLNTVRQNAAVASLRALCSVALALATLPALANDMALPAEVQAALRAARVPADALSVVVQEVGTRQPALAWQAQQPVNPASLMKLFTTYAALDVLGPAWTWQTPVWLQGSVRDPGPEGVLQGDLVIKGQGDPTLVMERLWLLLRQVQQLGVREIRGDIVLDRSAFALPTVDPGAFDNEPFRPYNVTPDALLVNHKSINLRFTPDLLRGVARVSMDPPLAGVVADSTVPLSKEACGNWRGALRAEFSDPARIRLTGQYPTDCQVKEWPVAYADPASYNPRAVAGMWLSLGGRLSGTARDGSAPTTPPTLETRSPPLPQVVRDINKFSNNVMAQQVFLTLALARSGVGTPDGAREVMRQWVTERLGPEAAGTLVIDNGSGLSREGRTTADTLARLLQSAWGSPHMPDLMSSLPMSGVDGTLRRAKSMLGRAHMKTGSLRDVNGLAGYVLAEDGRRHVVVAIINHPQAGAARPVLDAIVQWAAASDAGRNTGTPRPAQPSPVR